MANYLKNKNLILGAFLSLAFVFIFGYYLGKSSGLEARKVSAVVLNATSTDVVDFAPFWKAWSLVDDNYVATNSTSTSPETKINDQERVYGAIQGMVDSLGDPYTTFFPPVEAKSFGEEISGQIEGVGMQVDIKDGILTVISPVKDTPAYRAGVKAGDKILKIDEKITEKMSVEDAIKLIRGKKGTTVKITIFRAGVKEPLVFNIIRDFINLPTVDSETRNGVYIIHLYTFSGISTSLFRNALREFWETGNDKLILDLRGNPGGYLEAAQDIASWFLPLGEVVVKEAFKKEGSDREYKSTGQNVFDGKKLKMVVLIDSGSASASEILAGALHDHGVAKLVGTKSFGKGSVQELFELTSSPKTSLKVTIAKWLTPNGLSISHQGLTPDVEVILDEEAYKKNKTDNQLNAAIELLSKGQ